jgi:hypothetical protein
LYQRLRVVARVSQHSQVSRTIPPSKTPRRVGWIPSWKFRGRMTDMAVLQYSHRKLDAKLFAIGSVKAKDIDRFRFHDLNSLYDLFESILIVIGTFYANSDQNLEILNVRCARVSDAPGPYWTFHCGPAV